VEAIFDILCNLGLLGSVAFLVWGMALSARQGFGEGPSEPAPGPRHRAFGDEPVGAAAHAAVEL
jgi:hypothetical protein